MKVSGLHSCSLFVLIALACSCTTAKELRYFKDLPDSSSISLPSLEQEPRIIQRGDRLKISIGAKNPEAATFFNNYGGESTSGSGNGAAPSGNINPNADLGGFLVDEDGNLYFPIIKAVYAEGKTTKQLRDTLTKLLTPYLQEPLVNIRFMNFKFTVLGEVRSPGTFILSEQRTTLLDALGAAGDLPRSAKRYDIQLYRDYNGKRTMHKIDLRQKSLLNNSELFQIRHNDVVIVQPRDVQLFNEESRVYLSVLTLLLGTVGLIIAITK